VFYYQVADSLIKALQGAVSEAAGGSQDVATAYRVEGVTSEYVCVSVSLSVCVSVSLCLSVCYLVVSTMSYAVCMLQLSMPL